MPNIRISIGQATCTLRHLNVFCIVLALGFFLAVPCIAQISIDITRPSTQKYRIAFPPMTNQTQQQMQQSLGGKLAAVISNDLDLSGYFAFIKPEAFLTGQNGISDPAEINFKDWSTIGAELLLYTSYTCIGNKVEIEFRLFETFAGKQMLGKRALGEVDQYRYLAHRVSNEILAALTGRPGLALTKLAFVSDATGDKEIYLCDFDGQNLRQVTKDNLITMLPKLSPDGKKLTYTSYKEGSPMLYLKDLASGSISRLSGRSGINSGVSWLPDSSQLALTMSRQGNPDIYLVNLNGEISRQLTDNKAIDISPSFSPDGRRIAFVSDRSGAPNIYVLNLDTEKTQRLTFIGKYNTSPSWSSQNQIAFVSLNGGSLNIYTVDANGGQPRSRTHNQGKNEDPCWSPDGRYIVFSSNRSGQYKLYIMTANGQNQKCITGKLKGKHTCPSWGP